jgi:C-terminal processing protease CtpA/Prc
MNTEHRLGAVMVAALVLVLLPFRPAPASDTTTVEHLRAFAKLYGYVRFFHPSDQAAEVDWARFAVDGATRILEADGQEDLKLILDELFRGIAPTVHIIRSEGPPPWSFGSPPLPSASRVVAWQHLGVGLGNQSYLSIRTNRPNFLPPSGDEYGSIAQVVSAESHVGREVRLRAAVRAEVEGPGNQGQLWLQIDRESGGVGFYDAMYDLPVTSPQWDHYEIVGTVDEDGERIVFGAFLNGLGAARFDDFSLEVREPGGPWQFVPISNPGFEEHPSQPQGWWTGSTEYSYTVDDGEASAGSQSLEISSIAQATSAPEVLFDQTPQFGEKVLKDLGAGLWAVVPVALPIDSVRRSSRRVAPGSGGKACRIAARDTSVKIHTGDTAERVAAVIIAWNIFQHFYPYFDLIETDWNAELGTALGAALDSRDDFEFYRALQLLVAALHDGHGSVFHPDINRSRAWFQVGVDWIEDQVVVTASAVPEVLIGDVVVSIDGQSAVAIVDDEMRFQSGTTQWRRRQCLRSFGTGDQGSTAAVVVRRGEEELEFTLERTNRGILAEPRPQAIEEVKNGIYYVDLSRASMAEIEARVSDLAAATGVIFDLRGYPNGSHDVISYLIDEDVLSARWNVSQIIYPDQDRIVGWDTSGRWLLEPHEPRFQGTPVFLTDDRAISYAESVMGIVEAYGIADIVGRTTAGTNGDVNPFILPGGFWVSWTGMKVTKHDGSQHHLVGIIPTVPVSRTIAAVREGRDEDLDRAIEIIQRQQSD